MNALHKSLIDGSDDLRFLGNDDHIAIFILVIPQQSRCWNLLCAAFHAVLDCPSNVGRNTPGFFLRNGSHQAQHHIGLFIQRIEPLLLKINLDRCFQSLEISDGSQTINCVSRKSADGLGDNHVNLANHQQVHRTITDVNAVHCAVLLEQRSLVAEHRSKILRTNLHILQIKGDRSAVEFKTYPIFCLSKPA